jgi:hypothetical protein
LAYLGAATARAQTALTAATANLARITGANDEEKIARAQAIEKQATDDLIEAEKQQVKGTSTIEKVINILIESAMNYRKDPTEENYQTTLENFKTMMRFFYEHWMWTRELSDAYEPYKYDFHRPPPTVRHKQTHTRTERVKNSIR